MGIDAALSIRDATPADLDAVVSLEVAIFPTPWSRESLAVELEGLDNRLPLIALWDSRAVGFALGWTVVDELHLVSIGVDERFRRRGIAEALLTAMLEHSAASNARLVTLEVRAGNRAAVAFYDKHGFRGVAIRKGYYSDTGEDAIIMLRELPGP